MILSTLVPPEITNRYIQFLGSMVIFWRITLSIFAKLTGGSLILASKNSQTPHDFVKRVRRWCWSTGTESTKVWKKNWPVATHRVILILTYIYMDTSIYWFIISTHLAACYIYRFWTSPGGFRHDVFTSRKQRWRWFCAQTCAAVHAGGSPQSLGEKWLC